MKERGILFSAPLVRALLAGTKTQTRRLVKQRDGVADCFGACPYGQAGDRLWVRETWGIAGELKRDPGYVVYRADCDGDYDDVGNPISRWRPSIFMKRVDSRITLEVTSVRVERLQSITEEDAKAEGVTTSAIPARINGQPGEVHTFGPDAHRKAFALLWDAINGERASWSINPFVWVVSFRRLP